MSDNEKRETHADIIAEMHRFAKQHEYDHPDMDTNARGIEDYADRLEAAHERELAAGGNAAKLREALVAIDKNTDLLDIAENIAPKLHPSHSFVAVQIRKIVRAALASPPRNCDRFASAEEAWDAYDEWVESYRSKGQTPPFNEFGWLFAHATEKEGGAK